MISANSVDSTTDICLVTSENGKCPKAICYWNYNYVANDSWKRVKWPVKIVDRK
jgi:hypothetical protein